MPVNRQVERGLRFIQLPKKFQPVVSHTVIPQGSRAIQTIMRSVLISGPGDAPAGFVGGTTSLSEWYIYWALLQILGPEGDSWAYQESFLGGRHMPGGAVVDFIVYQGNVELGLRIQTFYYHLAAGSFKQSTDFEQRIALTGGGLLIIDVYEQDFINDNTGKAVLHVVREALAGIEHYNPRAQGTVYGSV